MDRIGMVKGFGLGMMVLGLFISFFCFGDKKDSLRERISRQAEDTNKVRLLNLLGRSIVESNPDSALQILNYAYQLSIRLEDKPGEALALKNIGIVYYIQGKYVEAIKFWNQTIGVYRQIGDKRGEANILGNQASVYFNQGDDAKSLELDLKSLKISESINDTLRMVTALVNIGTVYLNKQATQKKALDYLLRSYQLSKAIKDQYLMGTTSVNLGEYYYKTKDDDKALQYLKEAHQYYEGTEDLPYALNYLGRVYSRKNDFENAIQTHKEAFQIAKKLDSQLDMSQSLLAWAQAYLAKKDFDKAIPKFQKSLKISLSLKASTELKDAYEGLTLAYSVKRDFVKAFEYQKLLLDIKDTIYNINTDKKLGMLQFNFDLEKKEAEINLLTKDKELQAKELQRQRLVRNGFIIGFGIVLLFAAVFLVQRNRISKEKKRSDELLLNILPAETAEELKATGSAKVKSYDYVSVLFTDFKNFTIASENLSPEELVAEINLCFSEFDRIITRHGIEKIKTIGDAYMCAGGIPVPNQTHPYDVVEAGLEIIEFIEKNKQDKIAKGVPYFEIRLGIHTGPIVAGIVGIKKFAYDIWGDTVNTASRMESSGVAGKVNISQSTYELVKDLFVCIHRGKVEAKNKGEIDMYLVERKIS
jgi:class 3 adenylate cyclase/Flp pilus assembly protein TadD